jgi:hypothetical protein
VRERRSWVGNFPGMDNVINFRKRAQRFEERAATATDPEARGHWQRVADAWHRAAEAAARIPPLIWGWERDGGGTISGAIVPGHFPPKDTSLVTIFIGLAGALPTLTRLQELPRRAGVN